MRRIHLTFPKAVSHEFFFVTKKFLFGTMEKQQLHLPANKLDDDDEDISYWYIV